MPDQTNDLPVGGTERVETSDDDYSGMTDYWEPDEKSDDPVTETTETDEGAEDATTEGDESEEDQSAEVDNPEVLVDATAKVKLADGETVTVAQLLEERMMKQDHTRKTQEIAAVRKTVEADAKRIESITQTFIDHLSSLVPAAPDSALALRDPNAYVRAKAQHEAAIVQVQKLIEIADQPKQITDSMTDAQRQELIAEENRKLAERVPDVATDQGRRKFFSRAAEAANEMGFSMDELRQTTDHRLFVMAHYARIGMEAERSRAVAKIKAQAAPPVAPRKPGQTGMPRGNADAMRKLAQSGSIRDALKVDWD